MHQVHELIRDHGDLFYLITFLWTALEGETFVIFAGLAAQQGYINVWGLFTAAWIGSMVGDQIFFLIGRKFGTKIIHHFPKLEPRINRALGWLAKYAVAFILSYRFMYGLRNVSGVAVGLSNLPWKRFAVLNAIAAFVWATAFVGVGYIYGSVIEHMHHKQEVVETNVRDLTLSVLALFAVIIVARLGLLYWQRGRNRTGKN